MINSSITKNSPFAKSKGSYARKAKVKPEYIAQVKRISSPNSAAEVGMDLKDDDLNFIEHVFYDKHEENVIFPGLIAPIYPA